VLNLTLPGSQPGVLPKTALYSLVFKATNIAGY
jgi:hypothetical protein